MKRIIFAILASIFLWAGCREATVPAARGLVDRIEISCPRQTPAVRVFTDQDGMEAILNYLRTVESHPSEGQTPLGVRLYTITLTHRDGRKSVCYQIDDAWIRQGSAPWRRLDPVQGQKLPRLYASLPDR